MREYFPGFLAAFTGACDGIPRPEARTILAAAPRPRRCGGIQVAHPVYDGLSHQHIVGGLRRR
jgi:hypothetical protein